MNTQQSFLLRTGQWRTDPVLLAVTIGLVVFGLVMVYSASAGLTAVVNEDVASKFVRQSLFALVGAAGMLTAARVRYQFLGKLSWWLFIATLVFLAGVLVFGSSVNGARRWIVIGSNQFQPSEVLKFAVALLLASWFGELAGRSREFVRGLLAFVAITLVAVTLVLLEPDMGTAMIGAVTGFAGSVAAGARWRHLALLSLPAIVSAGALIKLAPYRLARLETFLDPLGALQPDAATYQVKQALIALSSGGLWGMGLGESQQKFSFLPEPYTDSILAVIGEELGFIGCSIVVIAFIVLVWRGFAVARHAPDRFGSLLATGITAGICFQALVNIAAVTSSIPFTGVPLPLISFGGTSEVMTLISIGVLLNISAQGVASSQPVIEKPAPAQANDVLQPTAVPRVRRGTASSAPAFYRRAKLG